MLSFWEKDFFIAYDHIVVGSGIVGLSTAIAIKEKQPNSRVLVLERGIFPTGASTKNAGFACFGSLSEIVADLEKLSEEEVFNLVKLRWDGLQLLRSRLGDEKIDYKSYGGYELLRNDELKALDQLDRVNNLLLPLFGKPVYSVQNNRISDFNFPKEAVDAMVFNPLEAQIHSGMMMKNLYQFAAEKGVEVITGAQVVAFEEKGEAVELAVADGPTFKAQQVAFCTNAFSKWFFPTMDIEPGRGAVLVTKPIDGLKIKGTYHYDEGYYYFRNYQNRVIFGGGRNVDFETEKTTNFDVNQRILDKLLNDLEQMILPNQKFEVDLTWSGIMAFGPNKKPILQKQSDRVSVGVRLGGMGVAVGSKIGSELADLMLQ
ncbi:FAD-dependent oxidoreductase [uncultured Roseivirga sp.]|uniref:NAD(P)/FAD-dependent oxidoreductase n=1 Tax=uncultured Roseivirga sp. TaxID=543088 RepID=UPI000D7B84E3|nr:FAD-dependent oxidoreductase [uncultured Roseivirga sp.]PWL29098.1 MAG: FAD-dependent oxidoreductase [Roseivirga sp. XM-24bin3]